MLVEKLKLRLDLLNSVFKISWLRRGLSMHQRFLVNLSDHNVPRLQQLVQVALKNNRSIGYILSNVMGGVDGIHMPNPTQSDKDLAFLVLKFGGPTLLNILYRAHVLPHESTAYRMAKMCPPIVSSVQDTVAKCFESNMKISETGRCAVSLKMDETYITPVLSYDQRSNQVCGACYQSNTKLSLDNFGDCENLQMLVEADQLHIPKECLVAGVSSLNENRPMQPFLTWPSCSKKDEAGTIKLIQTAIYNVLFIPWASDIDYTISTHHDLQASFIDVPVCCGKLKEYTPFEPIYLVINGTDPLERHFGNVRLMFKGGNYNVLDMAYAAWAMTQCDQLLVVDHPSWSKSRV